MYNKNIKIEYYINSGGDIISLKQYQIIGFIFTFLLGGFLHFSYEISNENRIVGYFSAINESTWEHLKMLITPSLIYLIIEYILYGKYIDNFIIIKTLSILVGIVTIIVLFYTYTGVLGTNYLILDISTFGIGVFLEYYFSYKMLQTNILTNNYFNYIGIIFLILIVLTQIIFTINPPKIALFLDPVTNTYGIDKIFVK